MSAKEVLGKGAIDRIGQKSSSVEHISAGKEEYVTKHTCPDHLEAIGVIIKTICDPEVGCIKDLSEIKAVGHRVVQGADQLAQSVIITDEVIQTLKSVESLAPLHNPANLQGIQAAQELMPTVPHCAVMDTAWHQTMPATSYMYATPYEWYEKYKVRRYGFHGTSYLYTAKRAAVLLGKKPEETNVIIAHIGNGASICAVKDGKSIDTSMGLTPLEGLIMGTRCGDMDPAIMTYIMDQTGMDFKELDTALNKKSGVYGITEKFSDRRDIQAGVEQGDERCILAQDMESYRLRKFIGAYAAVLGRVDAVVFTAGVGEMNPTVREKAMSNLENMGIHFDSRRNKLSRCRNAETIISTDDSPVKVFVIPTDEELVMTEDTYALVEGTYDIHTKFEYSFQKPDYVNKEREEGLKRNLQDKPELSEIIVKPNA